MRTLTNVYIKDEPDELDDNGTKMFSFQLIFPNKRRIYYFPSQQEKIRWISAIKSITGFSSINDFYELGEVLGKGKYGVVKSAFHKVTKQ